MADAVRVIVLVENMVSQEGLRAEHGLAVWIESDAGRILFDTGQGSALAPNAHRLGVDLSTANAIALSHGHYDHTGGLTAALRAAPNAAVYAHPSALEPKYACAPALPARDIGIPAASAKALAQHEGRFIETKGPTEVTKGICLTGEVPRETDYEDVGGPFYLDEAATAPDRMLDDQALYLTCSEGTVLVLGCAHAGVVNTMRYVAKLTGAGGFYCVMGGMHLVSASDERIARTIEAFKRFDVKRLGPVHCTGKKGVAQFHDVLADRCVQCAAGSVFEFNLPS